MQNIVKTVFIMVTILLTACTHTVTLKTEGAMAESMQPPADQINSSIIPQASFHTHSLFSDYTDSIATQLFEQSSINLKGMSLIITSFGYQARKLEDNHQLSYQLSESIAHELQPFGVNTIGGYQRDDFKYLDATGLLFDEDTNTKLLLLDSKHVLTGVITPNERGVMIHAKIVEITSMQVISTAEKFIPYYAFSH